MADNDINSYLKLWDLEHFRGHFKGAARQIRGPAVTYGPLGTASARELIYYSLFPQRYTVVVTGVNRPTADVHQLFRYCRLRGSTSDKQRANE
ncbi:hypothetical protein EVAR_29863_1 [Eumeta japonica]|uniref:Uncharacterized protein n=1 Tax=Eumeta variegata TaxID=151549 RepID=A0A4C1V6J7_EUMVA|nr:hypothetical protein EVAR_29863_1 [Eumeta japonica]